MNRSDEQFAMVDVNDRQIATAFHAASEKRIVLLCHGFRGSKIGPSRFFVYFARRLREVAICSLRFDHYGSGDSEGEFLDSSFDDWVGTTTALVERRLAEAYQISLVGQSMGGSSAIAAAAQLGHKISSVVAWAPDPSVDDLTEDGNYHEEGGERVSWRFWREAHDADIVGRIRAVKAPTLIFFATEDEYVSADNQRALIEALQPHQRIQLLHGHVHSSWTHDQAESVINQSLEFISSQFR